MRQFFVLSLCALLLSAPAFAADSAKPAAASRIGEEAKTVDAPDGAFGFADDSGLTGQGRYQATLDFLPSWTAGAWSGRDFAARAEINTGVLETLQLGVAIAGLSTRDTPEGEASNSSRNFALSLPGKWQLRAREVDNFGIAFLFEPYIGRQQNNPAPGGTIFGIDTKLAIDANVANQFFATFNLGYAIASVVPPIGNTQASGIFYLALAGTYRVTDAFYVGAQMRQAWQFATAGPDRLNGQAFSIGPTIAYQVNDNLTVSAVYLRQIAGNDPERPGSALELTDFRQNDARVRLTMSF
jgi:hypothetical protein